ncbi:RES family NAD+ phosphorylase [Nesterenkonia ebinurensis]|uniref:RES family NAD+ phosphorylase n=1 Tax=Nesterenkonia ebinurensis TaxID=2608252 RepID=UPI00123DA1D3
MSPRPHELLSPVAELQLVDVPRSLWRVGRLPDALNFSALGAEDAQNPRGGNRFDVPGGGVLYAATDAEGAFAETLARFRPSPAMRALPRERDEHFMEPGAVPADWRTRRRLVEFSLSDPLPFVDVDHPETHTALITALNGDLAVLGHDDLDVRSSGPGSPLDPHDCGMDLLPYGRG